MLVGNVFQFSWDMKKISYVFFIVILYLFFFNPPLLGFRGRLSFSNIIVAVGLISALMKPFVIKQFYKVNKTLFSLFVGLLIYVIFRSGFEGDSSFITKHILSVCNLFVVVPFVFYYADKSGLGTEKYIIRALLIMSSIAAFFSIICLLNPAFNTFVRERLIIYEETDFLFSNDYRGFGVSALLTSNYAYIQGFIGALGCFYLKDNKWFLLSMPFVLLSALINARTGFLVAFWGVVIFFLSKRKAQYSIIIGVVGLILFYNLNSILLGLGIDERTIDWIFSFQNEVEGVISSGSMMGSDTAETLFGRMWILPDTPSQWIFGRGYSLFRGGNGVGNSDVGWILQLNYGGIIYITILYSAILYILRLLIRKRSYAYMFFFLSTFLIINTKTSIYPHDTIFYLMMIVFVLKTTPANVVCAKR